MTSLTSQSRNICCVVSFEMPNEEEIKIHLLLLLEYFLFFLEEQLISSQRQNRRVSVQINLKYLFKETKYMYIFILIRKEGQIVLYIYIDQNRHGIRRDKEEEEIQVSKISNRKECNNNNKMRPVISIVDKFFFYKPHSHNLKKNTMTNFLSLSLSRSCKLREPNATLPFFLYTLQLISFSLSLF